MYTDRKGAGWLRGKRLSEVSTTQRGWGDGQGFGFRGFPVFFGHTGTLGGDQVGKARCELRRVVGGGCERKEVEAAGDGVSRLANAETAKSSKVGRRRVWILEALVVCGWGKALASELGGVGEI